MGKTLPPILVPGTRQEWGSPGVRKKPQYCQNCRYHETGFGFCPDTYRTGAKLALMFACPTSDDVNAQAGLSGGMGHYIYKNFIEPHQIKREDLLISHLIRCKPPRKFGKIAYPLGALRSHAESTCRKYDGQHGRKGEMVTGGLSTWEPNLFVLTFDPEEVHTTPAYYRQIFEDVRKASRFVEMNYRPLILFGVEACEAYAPFIKGNGGLKQWRGHYFIGTAPQILITDPDKTFKLL